MRGTILFRWAMEVHGALKHNIDRSSRSVPVFSMIDDQKIIYPCLFAFSFLGNVLIYIFQRALAFGIRKILCWL